MKKKSAYIQLVPFAVALVALISSGFPARFGVRQSGEGFAVGNQLVLAEYGYSDDGDRLRYAIFRTWPKGSTPEQRTLDPRKDVGFLGWPRIRDANGCMILVGTDGDVYLFDGDNLKTMKVRMNEHTDTGPLGNMKNLDEFWAYLLGFQVE